MARSRSGSDKYYQLGPLASKIDSQLRVMANASAEVNLVRCDRTGALAACAPGAKINIDKAKSQIQFTMPGENPELDKQADNGLVAGLGTGLKVNTPEILTGISIFSLFPLFSAVCRIAPVHGMQQKAC